MLHVKILMYLSFLKLCFSAQSNKYTFAFMAKCPSLLRNFHKQWTIAFQKYNSFEDKANLYVLYHFILHNIPNYCKYTIDIVH